MYAIPGQRAAPAAKAYDQQQENLATIADDRELVGRLATTRDLLAQAAAAVPDSSITEPISQQIDYALGKIDQVISTLEAEINLLVSETEGAA